MLNAAKVYAMLGNENLWETARSCHQLLAGANLPHCICGGVAVCLHGYPRNTVDLNMIIEPNHAAEVKTLLETAGLEWIDAAKEFRTPQGIVVQFLMTGD